MPAKKKKVAKKKAAVVTSKKKSSRPVPKMPKTVGGVIDAIYKQDQAIAATNKKLAEQKRVREDMVQHAFQMFEKSDMEGGKGKTAQASITRSQVPQADDWEKIHKYIQKTKDFAILQKRLAVTHIRDLWDDGKGIPGVSTFTKVGLSVTKVKKK